MTLKKNFSIFLLIFASIQLQAAEDLLPTDATNHLLILLDDSEANNGFKEGAGGGASTTFKLALDNEAFPIMISAHLLLSASLDREYADKINDNWIIKEIDIDKRLYLLLPHNYLLYRGKEKKVTLANARMVDQSSELTATEKTLGLKINHLKTIDNLDDIVDNLISLEDNRFRYADYFMDSVESVCITNKEYLQAKVSAENIPSTVIYMNGHGLMEDAICSLRIDHFKRYLQFLERCKIKLFVYNSCYGAGKNHELIYKDAQKAIQKNYTFTIVSMAITDIPTYMADTEKFSLRFFAAKTSLAEIPLKDAIESINPAGKNIPQIRYPGLEWFSVIDNEKNVLVIGSVLGQTRTEALSLQRFFKTQSPPKAILLYAKKINFEIKIDTEGKTPQILSMIPGFTIHKLKKIFLYGEPVEKLFKAFTEPDTTEKIFVIDEIEGFLFAKRKLLKKIIIDARVDAKKETSCYFTLDGKTYVIDHSTNKAREATEKEQSDYKNLLTYDEDSPSSNPREATKKEQGDYQKPLTIVHEDSPSAQDEEEIRTYLDNEENRTRLINAANYLETSNHEYKKAFDQLASTFENPFKLKSIVKEAKTRFPAMEEILERLERMLSRPKTEPRSVQVDSVKDSLTPEAVSKIKAAQEKKITEAKTALPRESAAAAAMS
jgi:hypothetical protein